MYRMRNLAPVSFAGLLALTACGYPEMVERPANDARARQELYDAFVTKIEMRAHEQYPIAALPNGVEIKGDVLEYSDGRKILCTPDRDIREKSKVRFEVLDADFVYSDFRTSNVGAAAPGNAGSGNVGGVAILGTGFLSGESNSRPIENPNARGRDDIYVNLKHDGGGGEDIWTLQIGNSSKGFAAALLAGIEARVNGKTPVTLEFPTAIPLGEEEARKYGDPCRDMNWTLSEPLQHPYLDCVVEKVRDTGRILYGYCHTSDGSLLRAYPFSSISQELGGVRRYDILESPLSQTTTAHVGFGSQ